MPLTVEEKITQLARLVRCSAKTAILTGAGLSTESGIPDFRGTNGLWQNQEVERLAHLSTFRAEPEIVWRFYLSRLESMRDKQPNPGHFAIATLEQAGFGERVVTQNIDGLHRRAGSDPVEVHGSLDFADCLNCRTKLPMADALASMAAAGEAVPCCDVCDKPLKPGVTLLGEMLPPAIDVAYQLVDGAELLIVCGSSLNVAPVSHFPWMVKAQDGKLAIVNIGKTAHKGAVDCFIDGPTGEILPQLVEHLLG